MSLRIGVAGVGFGSVIHIPAFQSEGIEVVAITTRRQERAEEAAKRFGVDRTFTDFNEMLAMPGLDAVSIVTPPALHHDMALAAISAGKHVICEKPFAVTTAQAKEMMDAATTSGLTAMVAHEFRFSSGRVYVKELIEQGYLGNPKFGLARILRPPWHGDIKLFRQLADGEPVAYKEERDAASAGVGLLYVLGSHYIDGLMHWFGDVASVQAMLIPNAPQRQLDNKAVLATADDTFFVNMEFANGLIMQLTGSRVANFANEFSIEVFGDKGVIFTPQDGLNPQAHGVVMGGRIGIDESPARIPIPERLEPFSDDRDNRMFPFRLFVREFLRGIEEGTSPSPNFVDAYRLQKVLVAIRQASATGTKVTIPGE